MHNIIHGANPENLYRCFGVPMPEKIYDFSTNTNIITWPEVSINVRELASRYPDPDCRKLREVVAQREGISPNRILFTNGTNEAIFLLSEFFGDDTAILQPNYSEYARAFTDAHDVFTLTDAVSFRHVIITNPGNPTGRYIHLWNVISSNPRTLFIILYEERERLCDFPNVIILRSLTKIFHLSGARIGYVIAPEDIISRLKSRLPSWNVNAIAQELALVFLNDKDFCGRTRNFYREHTPKFMNAIGELGFSVVNSSVHFFLVGIDDDFAVVKELLRHGVVVRHTRNFPGLSGKHIRIATRQPEENKILVEAMKRL